MLKVVLIANFILKPLTCWRLSKRDAKSVATRDEKAAEVKAAACLLCQRAHLDVRQGQRGTRLGRFVSRLPQAEQ
jgi:hypothetical protein